MGVYDLTAKVVLREAPLDLLRGPLGLARGWRARAEDKELQALGRTVDALLDLRLRGSAGFRLVVEVELEPRHDSLTRALHGWSRAADDEARAARRARRPPRPVRVLVVYLRRGRRRAPPRSETRLDLGLGQWVAAGFRALVLWEVEARDALQDGSPGLLPFLPFMRGATPGLVRDALAALGRAKMPASTRVELKASLALFATRVFPGVGWLARVPGRGKGACAPN